MPFRLSIWSGCVAQAVVMLRDRQKLAAEAPGNGINLANLMQVTGAWRIKPAQASADLDHDGSITVADIMRAAASLEPAGN